MKIRTATAAALLPLALTACTALDEATDETRRLVDRALLEADASQAIHDLGPVLCPAWMLDTVSGTDAWVSDWMQYNTDSTLEFAEATSIVDRTFALECR